VKKDKFHLYQLSFITPLLTGLKESGVALDRLFSKSAIRNFDTTNPEGYVPMKVLYDFLHVVSRDQHVEHIASTFYSDFDYSSLGDYGSFLKQCPDLLTVMLDGVKYEHIFQTNTKMKLEISGAHARFSQTHLDPFHPERKIAEDMAFAMVMQGMRMVLGPDWIPLMMQIPGKSTASIEPLLPKGDFPILYQQPDYTVIFPAEFLSKKNKSGTNRSESLPDLPFTYTERIQKILLSTREGRIPALTEFSEYFGVSERTIIRALVQEGTHYSEILERVLLSRSLRLLGNEKMTVHEISQTLGYSNPSNFVRAFKKWTKCTPTLYRSNATKLL
jgi:AraC-like DNA-binding protein